MRRKTSFVPALSKAEEKSQASSDTSAPIIPFIPPPEEKRPPIKKGSLEFADMDLWMTRIELLIEACVYVGFIGALGLLNFLSFPTAVWFVVLSLGTCLFLTQLGLNFYYKIALKSKGLSDVEALQQNPPQVASKLQIRKGREKDLPVEAYEEPERESPIITYFIKLGPFYLEDLPRRRRASQPALQQITGPQPQPQPQPQPASVPSAKRSLQSSPSCNSLLAIRAMRRPMRLVSPTASPASSASSEFWSPTPPSARTIGSPLSGSSSRGGLDALEIVSEESLDSESAEELVSRNGSDKALTAPRRLDFAGGEQVGSPAL